MQPVDLSIVTLIAFYSLCLFERERELRKRETVKWCSIVTPVNTLLALLPQTSFTSTRYCCPV